MKLPADAKTEQALLGAVLARPKEYQADVPAEAFALERHRIVWREITACVDAGLAPDLTLVVARLMERGLLEKAGGASYVAGLSDACAAPSHARHYADRVMELHARRQVIRAAHEAMTAAADPDEPIESVTGHLLRRCHTAAVPRDRARPVREVAKEVLDQIEAAVNGGEPVGISTGFRDLDAIVRLHSGDLIVVGGRPGMGKTGFALDVAVSVAQAGHTVLVHSLEMAADAVVRRILAKMAGVPVEVLRTGRIRRTQFGLVTHAFGRVADLPIVVDDSAGVSSATVRAQAERLHRAAEKPLGLVVVDYLQLMREPGRWEGRERLMIGQCTRALKGLAKDLGVPVLLLSQLSRRVEERRPPLPQLSDLRESGEIEQDADGVWLLYRPEYYLRDQTPKEEHGIGYVDVAKCRDGRTGTVKLAWRGETTSYADLYREA